MRLAYLAFGAVLFHCSPALPHDWYPIECCHSMDCAPVTSWSYTAGAAYDATGSPVRNALPLMVVTTKIGTAIVPADMPRRESKDNQFHACIRNNGAVGSIVTCIFVPPGM